MRRSIRRPVRFALIFALTAIAEVAHAQSPAPVETRPAKVVVFGAAAADPVVARIEAELRALGFEVWIKHDGAEPADRDALEASARAADAAAAIRVVSGKAGVDVWVVDRVTGKVVLRNVTAGDPATIAVRAVELLRASLLEVASPHPSRGEVAPDATVESVVAADRPRPPTPPSSPSKPAPPPRLFVAESPGEAPAPTARRGFGLQVGPGFVSSAGGVATTPLLWLDARFGVVPDLDLHVFGTIPLGGVSKETAEGRFDFRSVLAGAGASHAFTRRESWWTPSVGSGLALSWLHLTGIREDPHIEAKSERFAAVPYLTAAFALAPTSFLRIGPSALLGVALPRTKIDIDTSTVASFGRPLFVGALVVELMAR